MLALSSDHAFAQSAQLTISTPKTSFYLGEMIPLNLKFTALQPNRFLADSRQYDRIGRLNYVEQFIVDPASGGEDPLAGTSRATGGMGGLSGGPKILSDEPFVIDRVLNDYVRFRHPGEFRIHVVSHRVTQVDDPAQLEESRRFSARGQSVELISNTLTLSISPAPAAWIAQQIANARAVLAQPPNGQTTDRATAIAVLRALGTVDAAMELARATGDDALFAAEVTLLGSPHRKELLPLLEQRLVAPGQGIVDRQIETLAQLAEMVASDGPMPPYPTDPEAQAKWQTESKRRAEFRKRKQDEYVSKLIASLPSKQAEARLLSLHALLTLANRTAPSPPWLGQVASALAGEIRHLPLPMQREMLDSQWGWIRTPALLPALRELLDSDALRNIALRRIYELSPDEGRKIILDEIRHPSRNFDFSTLAMLPDPSLPALVEALADRMDPLLILRYASGEIVKQVEEKYSARPADSQLCAGPLALYFLKYDPPAGEKLLRADFAKPGLPPACYDLGFQFHSLGRWAYSPALERLAIASLTSDKVPVKRGAADLLGKYGSTAARKPLWETMEYFHSWWKDREKDLNETIGDESRQLELALRTALGNADAWVLTDAELRRLLDLCSSDSCRNDVKGWIANSASPVTIQAYGPAWAPRFMLGVLDGADLDWLTRKLSQFPPAVTFRIAPTTPPDLRDRIDQALRSAARIAVP